MLMYRDGSCGGGGARAWSRTAVDLRSLSLIAAMRRVGRGAGWRLVQYSRRFTFTEPKAVNREDKRSRRYRDRHFAKFERSRRYRDRYRCPGKKSRRGRDRDLVFRDPTPPRTRARSLIANRHLHLHNNNNIVAFVHTTTVATFTTTTIL